MAPDRHDLDLANDAGGDALSSPFAGTRAQRIQRLQVGLFGLAAMVMVLGMADIIMSTAESNQVVTSEDLPPVNAEDVPPPTPQRDPLAEAGVVPELPAEPETGTTQGAQQRLPAPVSGADVPPPANAP